MKAIVWSKDNCTYCDQAKKLLEEKGVDFEEKKIFFVSHLKTLESASAFFSQANRPLLPVNALALPAFTNKISFWSLLWSFFTFFFDQITGADGIVDNVKHAEI